MFNTDLAIRKTVTEIAQHRDNAIFQVEQMAKHYQYFKEECAQISEYCGSVRELQKFNPETIKKEVDRSSWRKAFSMTGISAYMDKKAREEFEKSLEVSPPEFTKDNIQSILLDSMGKSKEMFNRGTVELFKGLCGKYKCNDSFKVVSKIITRRWFHSCKHFNNISVNSNLESEINDLERIINVVKHGKFENPSLVYELRQCLNKNQMSYENEYLKINFFKNGNAHIYLRDQQVIDSINTIIAAYYGEGKIGKR